MDLIKKSLNVEELNDFIAGKPITITHEFSSLQESFSINDIKPNGDAKVVGIPGVTMVFDLEGSSLSIRQNGPAAFIDNFAKMFSDLTTILYRHSGIIEKFPGDGISAHFLKKTGETNLESAETRAVLAAIAIDRFMRDTMRSSAFRISMWTGDSNVATFIGNDYHKEMISIGHGVNVAHKLEKSIKAAKCFIGMNYSLAHKYETISKKTTVAFELSQDLKSHPGQNWYGVLNV